MPVNQHAHNQNVLKKAHINKIIFITCCFIYTVIPTGIDPFLYYFPLHPETSNLIEEKLFHSEIEILCLKPPDKNQSNSFHSKRAFSLLEIHHALSLFCTLRCLHKFSLYCFHSKHASKHTVLHIQYSPAHEI